MEITELLEIAADIRNVLEEERLKRKLTFEEENHKYTIYDPTLEESIDTLPSVSKVLENWYEPFDAINKSIKMCDGDERLAEELRNKWEKKGVKSSGLGSYVHYKLEQYIWSIFDIEKDLRKPEYDLSGDDLILAQKMIKNGVNMTHEVLSHNFVPLDTEVVMGSTELGYFGQCDNIWLGEHKGKLVLSMSDHKTNEEKNFIPKPYNKFMKPPFENKRDTVLSKYEIQQPLYAQLFIDMLKNTKYKDLRFKGFRIWHLRTPRVYKINIKDYNKIKKLYPIVC